MHAIDYSRPAEHVVARSLDGLATQLRDHLFHRAAGQNLDDGEVDQDDHEQRRRYEQQASDDIG